MTNPMTGPDAATGQMASMRYWWVADNGYTKPIVASRTERDHGEHRGSDGWVVWAESEAAARGRAKALAGSGGAGEGASD